MTWLVNSAVHIWGEQPYESGDGSRNNAIVALLVFGDVSAYVWLASWVAAPDAAPDTVSTLCMHNRQFAQCDHVPRIPHGHASFAMMQGWHNNHHAFEYSAAHGLEWWQVRRAQDVACTDSRSPVSRPKASSSRSAMPTALLHPCTTLHAQNAIRTLQVDFSYYFICLLEKLGLAWDVKRPTEGQLKARRRAPQAA